VNSWNYIGVCFYTDFRVKNYQKLPEKRFPITEKSRESKSRGAKVNDNAYICSVLAILMAMLSFRTNSERFAEKILFLVKKTEFVLKLFWCAANML
jgi:hypothetical protein